MRRPLIKSPLTNAYPPDLHDAVTEFNTEIADGKQVFTCVEWQCAELGLVAHAHSKRVYLIWRHPDKKGSVC